MAEEERWLLDALAPARLLSLLGAASWVSQAAEAGVTLTTSAIGFQVRPGVVLGSAGSWKNKNLFARRMERPL